jgi:ABC-type lipoprotein export system ATPase subunit
MLNEPDLILADEPTGNLDGDNAEIVLAALSEFARADGAVLLVSHDSRATQYATRRMGMRAGKLL